jgi:hypothetical protein
MSPGLVLLAATLASVDGVPPPPAGRLARVTVIVPKDQQRFEAGYQRHLEWHRRNGDRWTWLGWSVVSGDRLGWFVDGTFDRSPQEIDAPVAPSGDGADNENNVAPHATFASSSFYGRRSPEPALATLRAPFQTAATCTVRPGRAADFHKLVDAIPDPKLALELVSGGERPTWMILRPAASLAESLETEWLPDTDAAEPCRIETLRYRADLSYAP